jgi:hypothetical protein
LGAACIGCHFAPFAYGQSKVYISDEVASDQIVTATPFSPRASKKADIIAETKRLYSGYTEYSKEIPQNANVSTSKYQPSLLFMISPHRNADSSPQET